MGGRHLYLDLGQNAPNVSKARKKLDQKSKSERLDMVYLTKGDNRFGAGTCKALREFSISCSISANTRGIWDG